MNKQFGKRIIALQKSIVANFNAGHWKEIGLMTGHSKAIESHPRLLRSLTFGDEDYAGNA